jgi:hypothetical protein
MHSKFLLPTLGFFLGAWSAIALGQDDGNSSTKPKFDKSILAKSMEELAKGLDSNKLSERDATENKIIALGPDIIDLLPPVSDDISEEMRMRIDRIRIKLETQSKLALDVPTTVTLKGSMSGHDALKVISEKTGNAITLGDISQLERSVVAEFDETPFWEAVDEILDQIGLTIQPEDGLDIQLSERAEGAPLRIEASSYSGIFRMAPTTAIKTSNLVAPANNNLSLELLFAWEPRVEPSLLTFFVDDLEVVCDNGEVLTPISDEPISFAPVSGCQMIVVLDLSMPSREAKSIKKLTGRLDVTVPGAMASIAFTDIAKITNKTLTNGMLSVTLEKTRKNRNVHEVLIGVALKDVNESDDTSIDAWASLQDAYLFDKDLKRVENIGWSTTRTGDNEYGLSYVFDLDSLEGCRFVFRGPGSLKKSTIDFEINDIPLP